jgi:hypothetical protein
MDTKQILTSAITALTLPIIFILLYAANKRKARMVGNVSVAEYPVLAKAIGVFAVLGSGIMIFVASRAPANERAVAFAGCGIMALLFFFLPLEFYFRRIEFDEQEIVIRCVWRSQRRIPWTDVVAFVHLPRQKEWILETRNHGKIKFSTFLQGLHDLQAAAIKHGKGA